VFARVDRSCVQFIQVVFEFLPNLEEGLRCPLYLHLKLSCDPSARISVANYFGLMIDLHLKPFNLRLMLSMLDRNGQR